MTKLSDALSVLAEEGTPRGHAEVMRGARASLSEGVPPATSVKGRRPRILAFAAALVVVVAVAGTAIYEANRDADPRVDTRQSPTSSGVTTVPPAMTAPPPATTSPNLATTPSTAGAPSAGPLDSFRLGYDGLGPIKLGMTLEQASAASGAEIVLVNDPYCDPVPNDSAMVVGYYRSEGEQLWFGVVDGRIVNISTKNSVFFTISGIHVGDTRADVLRTYPNAEDRPEYGGGEVRIMDSQGRVITFYQPSRQSVEGIGVIRLAESPELNDVGGCN